MSSSSAREETSTSPEKDATVRPSNGIPPQLNAFGSESHKALSTCGVPSVQPLIYVMQATEDELDFKTLLCPRKQGPL